MSRVVPSLSDPGLVPYDAASRERYRSAGWWSGRTLPAELVSAARSHFDRVALVTSEVSWTYGQLLANASAFAAGIGRQVGVRPGDRVMFQMGNVAETVVSYLGCLLAGAQPVCTLPQHGSREIGLLAKHVGARTLILQGDFRGDELLAQGQQMLTDGRIEQVVVARALPFPGSVTYDELMAGGENATPESLPWVDLPVDGIAAFQLSGGTTGLPKIAPRLHEEYVYNSRAWAKAMGYTPESCVLYPLPLMHNAGISLAVQPALLSGSRLVLAPSADVETLVELIARYRPDFLPLVPPALAVRLLEHHAVHAGDLDCLRSFVVGGQKLPVEVAERLRDELGVKVRQMFGMAEGLFLLTPEDADEDVRHHMVGAPISPGDEIRILDPTGREIADETIGELATRGPYTIRGYYRAEAHNEGAFTPDGFFRTGDLARRWVTAQGVFYSIEGRLKDVINRGVEKIHAEEVEELIVQHPHVTTAALVAMPDPVLGERGCAFLIMSEGAAPLTVASLAEHLRAQGLATYKLPERVEVVESFPLTNVGKVSKKALREDIERRIAAEQAAR